MQPMKSWSGARVAVHGAPPFTFPVRRSDFFGHPFGAVVVGPGGDEARREGLGARRAGDGELALDGGLEADTLGREFGALAFVNELAGEGGLRLGVGGESQPGGGERDERGDHSHGAILRSTWPFCARCGPVASGQFAKIGPELDVGHASG